MKKKARIILFLQVITLCGTMLFGLSAITAPSQAATFVVTNESDSGAGSLRQAIVDASSGDTVTFAENVKHISLLSSIDITKNLTIKGSIDSNGTPNVTISNVNSDLFNCSSSLKLYGLSIEVNGNCALNCTTGTMELEDCKFNGNSEDGNAIISNECNLIIKSCSFKNFNSTNQGLIFHTNGGNITISNSLFSQNAAIIGGAIFSSASKIAIDHTTFSNNTAQYGGAIICSSELKITNSQFNNNTAQFGGAILNTSKFTVNNSSFIGNTALRGSAIYSLYKNEIILTNTTLYENSCSNTEDNGVIETRGKTVLVHSTLANNRGIGIVLISDSKNIYAYNSIIVGNTDQDGNPKQSNKTILGGKNIIEDIPNKGDNTYKIIFGSAKLENGHIAPLSFAPRISLAPKLNESSFTSAQLSADQVTEILNNTRTDAVGSERTLPIIFGAIEQLSSSDIFNLILVVLAILLLTPLLIVTILPDIEEP